MSYDIELLVSIRAPEHRVPLMILVGSDKGLRVEG